MHLFFLCRYDLIVRLLFELRSSMIDKPPYLGVRSLVLFGPILISPFINGEKL